MEGLTKFSEVKVKGQKVELYKGEYVNGKVYVRAVYPSGDDDDVTINLDGETFLKGYAHLKGDISDELKGALYASGVAILIGSTPYNFGTYDLVIFPDLLEERTLPT